MDNSLPKFTLACLCYNQAQFVIEALESVFNQTYPNLEIIIVDDKSPDSSAQVIKDYLKQNEVEHEVQFIENDVNLGNCKSFNKALSMATGKYIMDMAADDILQPNHVQLHVDFFNNQEDNVGLIYSNAEYFYSNNNNANHLHFGPASKLRIHEGWVFKQVVQEYFIPTSSTIFRTSALKELNGYDEELSFEDFDIWVRLSRNHQFKYLDVNTVQIRKHSNSMSTKWHTPNDPQTYDVYKICLKIEQMIQNKGEKQALKTRIEYEIRMCFLHGLKKELNLFYELLQKINEVSLPYFVYYTIGQLGIRFIRK